MIRALLNTTRSFARDESGTASIEFTLMAFPYVILFVSAIESGVMLTRQVMIERGIDMAVREVRLSTDNPPDYTTLREMICDGATILPDCMSDLRLEMVRINPWTSWNIPREADCINRDEPNEPVREFTPGNENEMVYMRACIQFRPIFPGGGLGFKIADEKGEFKIVADTVFVAEPAS